MGFYELGNGCDSCDTVQSILPNNVNMQMDPNSSMVASMVMPYGTQSNMVRQYNGAIASGYSTQGSNFGSMGVGSTGSTMGGGQVATQAMVMVPASTVAAPGTTVATTTTGKQVQVAAPGSVAVVVPASNSASNSNNKVEGFSDGSSGSGWQDPRKWVVLGLVIFSALAANECCKYFLNKSLQLNDGSPLYYVGYVAVAVLLAWAAETYIAKN
jgi:hypothetical protein